MIRLYKKDQDRFSGSRVVCVRDNEKVAQFYGDDMFVNAINFAQALADQHGNDTISFPAEWIR